MEKATEKQAKQESMQESEERRRRHFKEDFKRKVVVDILSGKTDKNNVKDSEGNKISKYLVDRWKAEYRGQKFVVDALSQSRSAHNAMPTETTASFTTDDLYKEVVKLSIENRKLKEIIAVKLDLPASEPFIPSKTYSRSF
jgi:hypothetical protein